MTQPAQGQPGQTQKKGPDIAGILGGALFNHPVFGKLLQSTALGQLFPSLFQQQSEQPQVPQQPQQQQQQPQGQPPQQANPQQFLGI